MMSIEANGVWTARVRGATALVRRAFRVAAALAWGLADVGRAAQAPPPAPSIRGFTPASLGRQTAIEGFLASREGVADRLDLRPIQAAQRRLANTAERVEAAIDGAAAAGDSRRLGLINARLLAVERDWLLPEGIPGRPWFRHALHAPEFTYAAMELPAVREAADQGDWPRSRRELGRLAERIDAVDRALAAATAPR